MGQPFAPKASKDRSQNIPSFFLQKCAKVDSSPPVFQSNLGSTKLIYCNLIYNTEYNTI